MITLSVEKFSCIERAHIELRPLTILIGPQASGKSLLSKLLFFFSRLPITQFRSAEEGNTKRLFIRDIEKKFLDWFPARAWGAFNFRIEFSAGPFSIVVSRKPKKRVASDEIVIELSETWASFYENLASELKRALRGASDDDDFIRRYNRSYPIEREARRELQIKMGSDYIYTQSFVPAGRSFFTNLNKAVAMLEHGSQLDEVTKIFGRRFTSLLDGRRGSPRADKFNTKSKEFIAHQKRAASSIMGGEIKLSTNDMHLATSDGRRIPLPSLSSGQQELLPLLLILQEYVSILADQSTVSSTDGSFSGLQLLYVEEPEAHLFPAAQGAMTELLAEIVNFGGGRGRVLMTTHSPYVLSKLNNLLKAAKVAAINDVNRDKVAEIIPKSAWLLDSNLNAYALENKSTRSIVEEDGLINAEYLDSISSDIAEDFDALLEIEYTRELTDDL